MKKILKYILLIVAVYVLLCTITPFNKTLRNRSIKNQITYLDDIMSKGYDDKLQNQFSEGKLFSNAIFSLSILDFCKSNNHYDREYAQIVDENIKRLLSNRSLDVFDETIQPEYGMFYNGWASFVLNRYQKSKLFQYSEIKFRVIQESKVIDNRFLAVQKDSIHVLDTYEGINWPADNLIGLISVKNDTIQKQWLDTIFNTTEHESGLIHHAGNRKYTIRGSSQSLITYCLGQIGYSKIKIYNDTFKTTFVDNYFGVQMVNENEDGSSRMDVDSGPVVLGYGTSATIMNIKTQASFGDSNAKNTWAFMNTISLPINIFGSKFYLFKQEPMFDIFMLWGRVEIK